MSAGGHLKQEEMLAVAAPVSEGNGPSLIGTNCFKINVDGESFAFLVCLHDEIKREKKCDSDMFEKHGKMAFAYRHRLTHWCLFYTFCGG